MNVSTKLGIGIGISALCIAAVVFRGTISDLLTFDSSEPSAPFVPSNLTEGGEETPVARGKAENQPADAEEPTSVKKTEALQSGNSASPRLAVYTGRDPAEIRPVPEEVKLFSEAQKKELYAALAMQARAVAQSPSYFNGWIQIGILKKTIGDFEGARDAWEYAGAIEPANSLSFANLGELYWRYLHEYGAAEKNLKTAIAHKPDDLQTYVTLAELYHYSLTEKADLAPQALLDGIAANPGRSETLLRRLAYLYEQRGEYVHALEWWEKTGVLHPDDQDVKTKIEQLRIKIGEAGQ